VPSKEELNLTDEEREGLKAWAQSRTLPAGDVFRAKLILPLADRQELCAD
jgi:hypothetical protein